MENVQELPLLILKYLKYMAYVRSASMHTIKAYSLDLSQAYNLHNYGKNGLNEEFFSPVFLTKAQALPRINAEELLNQTRAAMNKWARLSLSSRNRKIATLKSFFSWLYQESIIDADLSHQLHCPKVPRKLPHFISVDEVLACLNAFTKKQSENKSLHLKKQSDTHRATHTATPREIPAEQILKEECLFLLLYGAGLRISEACSLQWTDVSIENRQLRVLGKGNKERVVSAPERTFAALKKLKAQQNKNGFYKFIFGEIALDSRQGFEWIRHCGSRANLLKPLNPHALRHSFATHMLSGGGNLRTLQKMLGHESLQATEKYTHLGIDHLARVMESSHPLSETSRNKSSKKSAS